VKQNTIIKEKINDLKSFFSGHADIATVYLSGSYGTELYDPERIKQSKG
jgi:hypothetical protein